MGVVPVPVVMMPVVTVMVSLVMAVTGCGRWRPEARVVIVTLMVGALAVQVRVMGQCRRAGQQGAGQRKAGGEGEGTGGAHGLWLQCGGLAASVAASR